MRMNPSEAWNLPLLLPKSVTNSLFSPKKGKISRSRRNELKVSLTLVPLVFLSFSRQGVSPRVGSLTASTPKSRDFLKNHIRKSARTRKARARAVETSCNVRGGVMYACAPMKILA